MKEQRRKEKRSKVSNRARHRLKSIRYDFENVVQPTLNELLSSQIMMPSDDPPKDEVESDAKAAFETTLKTPALFCNERCGAWYFNGSGDEGGRKEGTKRMVHNSCHFKSTDGHVNSWWFSLKRLNLNVIYKAVEHQGCIILDASVSKNMPDSFSRTIPIWAAVMNRIVARYREQEQQHRGGEEITGKEEKGDDLAATPQRHQSGSTCSSSSSTGQGCFSSLHTPSWVVDREEHETIAGLLDERVDELLQSRALVDPRSLVATLDKPLRPYWVTPQQSELPSSREEWDECYPIICLNCSKQHPTEKRVWMEEQGFWYTPGAADDQESWARHLDPRLFWKNIDKLLLDDNSISEDDTDEIIDAIVREERLKEDTESEACSFHNHYNLNQQLYDEIGSTGIYIGSRRAGRPPDCWDSFDAILNVTDTEYENMMASNNASSTESGHYYLQLPVREGKRDRTELERWLPAGLVFCALHAQQKRRILIHCAQGKDRSVAIALAFVVLFCNLEFPLRWNETFDTLSVHDLLLANSKNNKGDESSDTGQDSQSGIPVHVESLLGEAGREWLFRVIREHNGSVSETTKPPPPPLATKETIRIALHLIRQDREQADPTRSTMQKLNRFFMSGAGGNKQSPPPQGPIVPATPI